MKHFLTHNLFSSCHPCKLETTELDAHLTEREVKLQRWEVNSTKGSPGTSGIAGT